MTTLTSIFSNLHKGAIIFGFDTKTVPTLKGGKSNPMQGRVEKVMVGAVAMANRDYGNSRNKQLIAAGYKPTYVVKPRKWGTYLTAGLPIITHKGEIYLNTSILSAGKVHYLLDGKPIDKADIIGLNDSKGTGIDAATVAKQLNELSDDEKRIIAVNSLMIDEALASDDSINLTAEMLEAIKANSKELYPRDFKAASITAIRVGGNEFTDIDSDNA